MKQLMFFALMLIVVTQLWAQTPQSFRYQAVARDNSGAVLANQPVSFRISILSGSAGGTAVYSETHSGLITNAFGLVELEIGKGTPVTGSFSAINWFSNSYFVKVEMDPAGGTTYQELNTSQLLSVPYALHSKTVETGDNWGSQTVNTNSTLTGNGTVSTPLGIADNGVTSAKIQDGTIGNADLSDNAVTTLKIADGTIVTADVANSTVTTEKLGNLAVSAEKIQNTAVTAEKLAGNAVTETKIATGAVTGAKIAQAGATTGQTLKWNGTTWAPANVLPADEAAWNKSGNNIYYNTGNVGIGTATPSALLHTSGTGTGGGNVLFSGGYKVSLPGNPPATGAGTRMMWYPDKAAFRAGYVDGAQWDKDSIGGYSVAMGYNARAKGESSLAFGVNTKALGFISTAMGFKTIASGEYSTAIGVESKASGRYSIAMGDSTTASEENSIAMGVGSTASAWSSTAMGWKTTASAWLSIAMGSHTTASGYNSTAMGNYTTAPSGYEIVFGRYNTDYSPLNKNDWNVADRLLVLGNGTSSTTKSDAIVVLKNGNTGLGTSYPAALLHTRGTGTGEGNVLFVGTHKSISPGSPPASGAGTRMMWYPDKAAFRVGQVIDKVWDKDSIGPYSVAMGYNTKAIGLGSFAMGNTSAALGQYSIAIGGAATASARNSFAVGSHALASEENSVAIGSGSVASGTNSIAIGFSTEASGLTSIALNSYTTALSMCETVTGNFNTEYVPKSKTAWNAEDRLFVIGNGTDYDARSNALTVLKNGNTGLGTEAPGGNRLKVVSNASGGNNSTLNLINENSAGIALRAATNSTDGTALLIQQGAGYSLRCDGYDPNFFVAMIVKGRQVGINTSAPTQNLDVNGNARFRSIGSGAYSGAVNRTADGTLTASTSDIRLKENISTLNGGLDKVMQLRGVSFTWKNNPGYGTRIGFIAQEVEKVLPELVFTNETDGYKGVNYAEMSAVLVEAIKELKVENERLKKENSEIKAENLELKASDKVVNSRLERLEQLIGAAAENKK